MDKFDDANGVSTVEESPGIQFALLRGVDIDELHKKVQAGLDGESIPHFTNDELRVLKACIEVACEF